MVTMKISSRRGKVHGMRKKILPFLFLAYGLYSMLSLQRDFQTIQRLTIYLFLLIPAFILFSLAFRWYEDRDRRAKMRRFDTAFHFISRTATQNLTQYILMFCLPFFLAGQHWFYMGINLLCLATLLWEPWWSALLRSWVYRRAVQLWSSLCASSFLLPFLWPQQLRWFYWMLTAVGLAALLPARFDKKHLLILGSSALVLLIALLGLPLSWRFPILSVWLQKPHFETDTLRKDSPHLTLQTSMPREEVLALLQSGHSLCCVAPIVAPPQLREKIQQEWTLDGELIERPELKTTIAGNAQQRAFRSYYCKQNFPKLEQGETLRCRLFLQEYLYLGSAYVKMKP